MGQLRFAWDETEALIRATARVERMVDEDRWVPAGTAFFVTEQQLLTCAHVAVRGAELRIVWHDGEGGRHVLGVTIETRAPDVDFVDPYPTPDVALLTVGAGVPDHPVAWLDTAPPGEHLWAFGYTDEYREHVALGNPARFTPVGPAQADDQEGGVVWSLKADRVRGGMSGSPLLDLESGRVVGLVKRTRDRTQALGGWATPMADVLAALPGLDADNAKASPQARAQALAEQLWGFLLKQAAVPLSDPVASEAVADELGLAPGAGPLEVARALFVADLDTVATCAAVLLNLLGPEPARRVFEAAAVCTSYEGEPWIAPAAAAELAEQVEALASGQSATGRVLRLPSGLPGLRELYRRRGDRRRRWRPPLGTTPFSHLVDDATGLPADFETGLRIAVARKAGAAQFAAATLDGDLAAQWETARPELLATLQKQRVVGLLGLEHLDGGLVDALVSRYPLVFLVATAEEVAEDVAARAGYQELADGIDDERVGRALMAYTSMMEDL